jgi:hypothetical protein
MSWPLLTRTRPETRPAKPADIVARPPAGPAIDGRALAEALGEALDIMLELELSQGVGERAGGR